MLFRYFSSLDPSKDQRTNTIRTHVYQRLDYVRSSNLINCSALNNEHDWNGMTYSIAKEINKHATYQ